MTQGPIAKPGRIRQAVSAALDPATVAAELHAALAGSDALVLLFCAPEQATAAFAAELGHRFPGVPVVGCTGAGEIGPGGYHEGVVTAVGLARPDFEAVACRLFEEDEIEVAPAERAIATLRRELDARLRDRPTLGNRFALLFTESESRREEAVASLVGGALADLPVLGGSASHAQPAARSRVLCDGRFHERGAVLVLVATDRPVRDFRSQHFVASERRVVVTGADPRRRLVTELDAEPAAACYARLVGLPVEELTPMVFATNPLVVRLGGAEYVRSIQSANPDGSLSFYSAIDEGLVLTLSEGHDLLRRTEELFAGIRAEIGPPELVIGFECVLNRLEAERTQIRHRLSRLHAANNVTGFASFGEQWGRMHVNQTFTGIAVGRGEEP